MLSLLIDSITHISLSPIQLNEAITEAKSNGKTGMLLKNVLLQEKDKKNQNNRVYPGHILEREVAKYNENYIQSNSAFGELDHPESSTVRLKETSHMITEIHWEGSKLLGSINILDTDNGKIAQTILSAGGQLGISSRALGSTKKVNEGKDKEEYDEVEEDLEILCWDIVSNPSVLKASFRLHEGLEINTRVLDQISIQTSKIESIIDKILTI